MQTFHYSELLNGRKYMATLIEGSAECNEFVKVSTAQHGVFDDIHEADFPTRYLGDGSRHGYLRSLVRSLAYADRVARVKESAQ